LAAQVGVSPHRFLLHYSQFVNSSVLWRNRTQKQILIPTGLGYLGDARLPPERRHVQKNKLRDHRAIFSLAALMALAAIGLDLVRCLDAVLMPRSTFLRRALRCWHMPLFRARSWSSLPISSFHASSPTATSTCRPPPSIFYM
jgi:hypothetical protein